MDSFEIFIFFNDMGACGGIRTFRNIKILQDSIGLTRNEVFCQIPFPRDDMCHSQCHFQGFGCLFQRFLLLFFFRDVYTEEFNYVIVQCLAYLEIIIGIRLRK